MVKYGQEIAEGITKLPIMLLNTHADPDHISGNGSFDCFYMHPDEEDNYKIHGGPGVILPVKDNEIIDLGNRPLKIIFIPGHTPGSVAILDISNRVLISGDTIQDGNIFMFKEHRNNIIIIFGLYYHLDSSRIAEAAEPYPNRRISSHYPEISAKLIRRL